MINLASNKVQLNGRGVDPLKQIQKAPIIIFGLSIINMFNELGVCGKNRFGNYRKWNYYFQLFSGAVNKEGTCDQNVIKMILNGINFYITK